MRGRLVSSVLLFFLSFLPVSLHAEIELIGKEGKLIKRQESPFTVTSTATLRTDAAFFKNLIDLDNKMKKDKQSYIGGEYFVDFDVKYKERAELFFDFRRAGPFYDDVPLLGRRHVSTIYGNIDHYRNNQFLPELRETWADVQIFDPYSIHAKTGLLSHEIGNGFTGLGYYDNYGASLYHPGETFEWTFHYNRPDWNNRIVLGPSIEQEKTLGRSGAKTVADFFSFDFIYHWKDIKDKFIVFPKGSIQPYITFLSDRTGAGKRLVLFNVQTEQDLLGTAGADLNLEMGRFSFGFEGARNFGQANVMNPADEGDGVLNSEDVVHKGYFFYGDASIDLHEIWLTPRGKLMIASGNRLDRSADNGTIEGSVNRAFSVYSPLNANLFDSIYPSRQYAPLGAMGNGWAANEGILRPGTFGDPYLFEGIIAPNAGFDITPSKRVTIMVDWWYLHALDNGYGTFMGNIQKLSRDLGHEIDIGFTIKLTENIELASSAGYFIPGKYYRTLRDDTGTTFSPIVRSGEDADNAIHAEASLTLTI